MYPLLLNPNLYGIFRCVMRRGGGGGGGRWEPPLSYIRNSSQHNILSPCWNVYNDHFIFTVIFMRAPPKFCLKKNLAIKLEHFKPFHFGCAERPNTHKLNTLIAVNRPYTLGLRYTCITTVDYEWNEWQIIVPLDTGNTVLMCENQCSHKMCKAEKNKKMFINLVYTYVREIFFSKYK